MAERPLEERNRDLSRHLGEKLDVPGGDLRTVVARAGRLLPRRLRRDARYLVEAQEMAGHPKLAKLLDPARLARADARLRDHVRDRDPDRERVDRRLGWLAGLAFNMILLAALVIAVLYWRGLIGPGA